jgi:hypothetical protein
VIGIVFLRFRRLKEARIEGFDNDTGDIDFTESTLHDPLLSDSGTVTLEGCQLGPLSSFASVQSGTLLFI